MKKILITGSTGFIGSNIFLNIKNDFKIYLLLRRKLRKKKINFIKNQNIKIINFKNYDELNFKIKKITVDVIIHCATYYVKKHKDKDISKIIDSNILFPNIILKNLKKMKVKKFINFTTVWENYNAQKDRSFNLYSKSKQIFRKNIDFYKNNNKKIKFYNFFVSDTYGENDSRKKLINVLKNNYSKNKITKILSKKLYINLLNVKDILQAVNLIINKKINPGNYVLKNKYNFNLQKIVSKINYNNKKKIKIKWISSKIIKEKFYEYKKLPYWKPQFSNIDDLANFITK
jgi:nucleoside-diphosphate-sugar epimerase